ncbi:MAG: aminotransferase class I/II-fold pyridoxal phosphate-dependent enzyme [Planctomycetaceae bacterium]
MPHDLSAARRRIASAYDPAFLRESGTRLIELVSAHLEQKQHGLGPVLNWAAPRDNIRAAQEILRAAESTPTIERFSELIQTILARGQNLHHPHYVGHQVPASIPLAGLFDAVSSLTNQVMAVYEMGPWSTAIEKAVIEELGKCLGFPTGQFAGLITHGGSLANLTALLTARNVALKDVWEQGLPRQGSSPVLVVQSDVHYCVARSAGILGLGTNQVIKVPLDNRRRMDPAALNAILTKLRREGRPIIAVAASSCATPIGAFDPLDQIAPICRKHAVWLHVDAAHGASTCLSDKHRHLVAGLEQADSVVWDAHKMMFMPALCAFVFYRDARHRFAAFEQQAPYLFDPTAPDLADYDVGLMTVECTKRAAAFGLWGVWSLFGIQLFADLVDVTFDLGRKFYDLLRETDDFIPLHEPQCNIVVFRHVPERLRSAPAEDLGRFQLALRRKVIESGEFYLVPTQFEGSGALRVTLINPLTTETDLRELLECLRRTGQSL